MNKYRGDVIEESLKDKEILKKLNIASTRIEMVTENHKTPWLSQWTIHTIEVSEDEARSVAEELRKNIDCGQKGSWYIDFKNGATHYVIYHDKVFCINQKNKEEYEEVREHGRRLGIPEHQLVKYIILK